MVMRKGTDCNKWNPLPDFPGQWKILLGNQKFEVPCQNEELKFKHKTELNWNFVIIFAF